MNKTIIIIIIIWYKHKPESVLENDTHKILWDFEIQTDPLISDRRQNLPYRGFYRPADRIMKMEVNEKIDKNLDLARELKKTLWNMRVKVLPIVIGALGKVPKGLERSLDELEIRGRIETIQTTALLKSARIIRSVVET